MLRRYILQIYVMMICSNSVNAQLPASFSAHWKVAATLPPSEGQTQSLGLAGPITGQDGEYLWIGGGANFPDKMPWLGGKKKYYDALYLYAIRTDSLVRIEKTYHLPEPLAYAACSSTPEGVMYAGGENEKGISKNVFLVRWDDQQKNLSWHRLPDLPKGTTNASAATIGSKVYLAGGETAEGVSSQWIMLDLNELDQGWQQLPLLPQASSHAVLIASKTNNTFYLIGGRQKNQKGISELYDAVYAYEVNEKTWNEKKPLPFPLSAGTGTLVQDHTIMLFGGDRGVVFHQVETLISAINQETDSAKRITLENQKILLQSTHPGFCRDILLYDLDENTWDYGGVIPYPTPVTTTAIRSDKKIWLPSGEVKAGVRTSFILEVQIK